jgi:hypothetical protein
MSFRIILLWTIGWKLCPHHRVFPYWVFHETNSDSHVRQQTKKTQLVIGGIDGNLNLQPGGQKLPGGKTSIEGRLCLPAGGRAGLLGRADRANTSFTMANNFLAA